MGWGVLCAAGGGAYYFAKQGINADRAAKLEEARRKKAMIAELESMEYSGKSTSSNGTSPRTDSAGSPSQEASQDPAPTRHAPATEGQRVIEKSKYESSVPFKSPKGDRFS